MQFVVAKATNAYLIAWLQDNVIVVVQRDLLDLLGHCFLFSCGQGVPVFCNRLAVHLKLGLVAVIITIVGERSICFVPAVICGNIRIIRKIRHRTGGCPLGIKHITYPVRSGSTVVKRFDLTVLVPQFRRHMLIPPLLRLRQFVALTVHFQGMAAVIFAILCIFLPLLHRMSIDTGSCLWYRSVERISRGIADRQS